jgi:hypothetical protein
MTPLVSSPRGTDKCLTCWLKIAARCRSPLIVNDILDYDKGLLRAPSWFAAEWCTHNVDGFHTRQDMCREQASSTPTPHDDRQREWPRATSPKSAEMPNVVPAAGLQTAREPMPRVSATITEHTQRQMLSTISRNIKVALWLPEEVACGHFVRAIASKCGSEVDVVHDGEQQMSNPRGWRYRPRAWRCHAHTVES